MPNQRKKYTDKEINRAENMLKRFKSERKAAHAMQISRGKLRSMLNTRSAENGRMNTTLTNVDADSGLDITQKSKVYVITCAQNNTPLNSAFFNAIKTYIHRRNAQLLVIPMRYKNPTGYGSEEQDDKVEWDRVLYPFMLNDNLNIGKHLTVFGRFQIQATAAQPLSGLSSVGKTKSGIFGHPNIALQTIPTAADSIPRMLATTGSITKVNYSRTKMGQKAELEHHAGAIIIEDDGDLFHLRHISDSGDGSFYDMTSRYLPDGSIEENIRLAGLVLGDLHVERQDKYTRQLLVSKDGLINTLKPKKIVIHDAIDCEQISHHNTIFNKYQPQKTLLQAAEDLSYLHSDMIMVNVGCEVAYVESNHFPGHAQQWLERYKPNGSYDLDMLYHKMSIHCMPLLRENKPINLYGALDLKLPYAKYLTRNDRYMIMDIDCGQHGDKGLSGARGSAASFAKTGYKTIIGHSHMPRVIGGCWQAGTLSKMNLGYNSGYGGWQHTNIGVYPDGNRTFLTMVGNRWHGEMKGLIA